MPDTYTLETIPRRDTLITITSVALKKGKQDKMVVNALCSDLSTDNSPREKAFILQKTSRDFQRRRFPLEPGCTITDEAGSYECTSVSFTSHPKYPILITRPVKLEGNDHSLCAS